MNHPENYQQIPIIAVFDFDDTLTKSDSLLPFFRFTLGRWRYYWGMLLLSPVLAGYALKLIPNWRAKEIFLIYFLGGRDQKKLNKIAQNFAFKEIPKLLRSEAINRLRWHQEQGHKTILLSASLEIYLIPWAKNMGFSEVLGTQLAIQKDRYTGRIFGKNCHGEEKVRRLQSLLGNLSQYYIHAYGDSRGDLPLLNIANYPYYRTFEINS